MKRLQIMIEPELDEAVARVAHERGVSKAAVIRRAVRDSIEPLPSLSNDSLLRMAGEDDFAPDDIDDVIYR